MNFGIGASKIRVDYELRDYPRVSRCCPKGHRYETFLEIKNGIFVARNGINIGSDLSGESQRFSASRLDLPNFVVSLPGGNIGGFVRCFCDWGRAGWVGDGD